MEQVLMEYLANAFWQLPLLATGAWLLLRITKHGPRMQHRVWLAVMALAVVLPFHGSTGDGLNAQAGTSNGAIKTNVPVSPTAVEDLTGSPLGPKIWSDSDSSKTMGGGTGFSYSFASHVHRISISAEAMNWIVALYLGTLLIAFLRLTLAWVATRRLVQHSLIADLSGQQLALARDCAARMAVPLPQIRESALIAGPVVIGAVKPVLLWPEGLKISSRKSSTDSTEEVKAALCHEFAHIRRRDYLANLLSEVASIPLKWHPVMFGVERRIRSTREMVCDAMAAAAMGSETKYAECLLSLAQRMVGATKLHGNPALVGAGLFTGNVLEERVMRLMDVKETTNSRARITRGLVGAAALMATALVAVTFHLVPAMAQETIQPVIEPAAIAPVASVSLAAEPAVAPEQLMLLKPAPMPAPVSAVALIAPLAQTAPAPTPAVAPEPAALPAPQANAPLDAPLPKPATPAPAANSAPQSSPSTANNSGQIIINGIGRKLTPEERQRIEMQLKDAQRQIAAEEKRLNSPEFRKQIADAERQAIEASRMLQNREMQQQLAEAQEEIAAQTDRLNSPEFKKQIEEAQRYASEETQKIDSAQLQKQLTEAQREIAASAAKLNSPEFRKQIEDAVRQAQQASRMVDNAQMQKQLDDAQKQIADQLEKMKVEDGNESK